MKLDNLHIHLKYFTLHHEWFQSTSNTLPFYHQMGGEKGFAIYLNLFKFLRDNRTKTDDEFLIYTSMKQIYDNCNQGRRVFSYDQILYTIEQLQVTGIITCYTIKDWRYFREKKRDYNQLLIIQLNKVEADKDKGVFYQYMPLDVIQFILSHKLTYKHISVFMLLMSKVSWKEEKAYISINKMAEWLKLGDTTVHQCIYDLNILGAIATYRRKRDVYDGMKFEHKVLNTMDKYEQFKKDHEERHQYFINKEKRKMEKKSKSIS